MPLRVGDLRRGRMVWAIFPFTPQFPVATVEGGRLVPYPTVEDYVTARRGTGSNFVTSGRLRPVLLLHDGTRGDHDDVLCLRVNSVKPKHRRATESWRRISAHEHPFFFHIPPSDHSGLRAESLIDLTSIGSIHKSSIAAITPPGGLDADEMRAISNRLRNVLALDLSDHLTAEAKKLLAKALTERRQPSTDP